MKNLKTTMSLLVLSFIALTTNIIGCGEFELDIDEIDLDPIPTLDELLVEEKAMIAIVNQTISAYHEASLSTIESDLENDSESDIVSDTANNTANATANTTEVVLSCNEGGELTITPDSNQTTDYVCYNIKTNGCTSIVYTYTIVELFGSYRACGFPIGIEDNAEGAEILEGKTIEITGNVTSFLSKVYSDLATSLSCNYDLKLKNIKVYEDDYSSTDASLDISGSSCHYSSYMDTKTVDVSGQMGLPVAETPVEETN